MLPDPGLQDPSPSLFDSIFVLSRGHFLRPGSLTAAQNIKLPQLHCARKNRLPRGWAGANRTCFFRHGAMPDRLRQPLNPAFNPSPKRAFFGTLIPSNLHSSESQLRISDDEHRLVFRLLPLTLQPFNILTIQPN